MQRRLFFALTLIFALLALPAAAQVTQYSDVPAGTAPLGGDPAPPIDRAPEGGLTFYNVLADFEAAAPGLPTETFAGNLIGANNVCSDFPPLDDTTNDACFAAGGVIPGFQLDIIPSGGSGQYVLLTAPFLGIGITAVGPNTFTEDTIVRFDPPVNAVGFDMVGDLITPVAANIDFYDAADQLLGSAVANGSINGTFFGATSDTPIARIEMLEPMGGGELFGNLTFGPVAPPVPTIEVPTLGQYGLAALLLLLVGTGVFYLRRR